MLTAALSRTPTPRLILRFVGLELGGLARRTARYLATTHTKSEAGHGSH